MKSFLIKLQIFSRYILAALCVLYYVNNSHNEFNS